jgi:ABC-type multidrug transport system fused ATPase/permease subunit
MENRTAIIIAHRLSTIKHVDKIFVLEHGAIIES